jgi:hypothetical protein
MEIVYAFATLFLSQNNTKKPPKSVSTQYKNREFVFFLNNFVLF